MVRPAGFEPTSVQGRSLLPIHSATVGLVRAEGLEPSIPKAADFKSAVYANSTMLAFLFTLGGLFGLCFVGQGIDITKNLHGSPPAMKHAVQNYYGGCYANKARTNHQRTHQELCCVDDGVGCITIHDISPLGCKNFFETIGSIASRKRSWFNQGHHIAGATYIAYGFVDHAAASVHFVGVDVEMYFDFSILQHFM